MTIFSSFLLLQSAEMNVRSSRSHLIITITVQATNQFLDQTTKGKITIVDLAGSERVLKNNATFKTIKVRWMMRIQKKTKQTLVLPIIIGPTP